MPTFDELAPAAGAEEDRRRTARPGARHRHDRQRQEHVAGGDVRPHQQHPPTHIITIEDPIEYLHRDNKSILNQREIRSDTRSFAHALRSALRQDPDVILVGEMRDLETIETALHAAETGHLVFSTLHTLDATETHQPHHLGVPAAPAEAGPPAAGLLLKAAVSQRLIPRADGAAASPAVEVLIATPFVRDCIVDKEKTHSINGAIAQGTSQYGMQTFDQSIFSLFPQGLVTYDDALRWASNSDEFKLKVQGISTTSEIARDEMLEHVAARTPRSRASAARRRRERSGSRSGAVRTAVASAGRRCRSSRRADAVAPAFDPPLRLRASSQPLSLAHDAGPWIAYVLRPRLARAAASCRETIAAAARRRGLEPDAIDAAVTRLKAERALDDDPRRRRRRPRPPSGSRAAVRSGSSATCRRSASSATPPRPPSSDVLADIDDADAARQALARRWRRGRSAEPADAARALPRPAPPGLRPVRRPRAPSPRSARRTTTRSIPRRRAASDGARRASDSP